MAYDKCYRLALYASWWEFNNKMAFSLHIFKLNFFFSMYCIYCYLNSPLCVPVPLSWMIENSSISPKLWNIGKRSASFICFGICPMNSLTPPAAAIDEWNDDGDGDGDGAVDVNMIGSFGCWWSKNTLLLVLNSSSITWKRSNKCLYIYLNTLSSSASSSLNFYIFGVCCIRSLFATYISKLSLLSNTHGIHSEVYL